MSCIAALGACHKPAAGPSSAKPAATPSSVGYVAPPEMKSVQHSAAGGVEIRGVSRPEALIELLGPDGTGFTATADHAGAWEMRAPSVDPRLYVLAEKVADRLIRSRAYVVILPAPGIAALGLRPGSGPRSFAIPSTDPVITAIDYDRGGAAVVSGLAGPDRAVKVQLDGQDVGEGRTDRAGAFSVSLSDVLKPGGHVAAVRVIDDQGVGDVAQARFEVGPASAAFTPPLSAQRQDNGWRLDWQTPGGGVQTTLAFDTEPRA
jgi:hypothetical protein